MAFGRLMDATLPLAYRIAFRFLGSADEAQDVCQDAFIRVWEHFPSFDRTRSFEAWLTTIISRLAIDRLRRRQRSAPWFIRRNEEYETAKHAVSNEKGADENAEWSDLHAVVIDIAGRLPPMQRIVFALRDLEDLDVSEVASVTGISTSSVKANLSYARRRIREILIADYHVKEIAS